MTPRLRFVLAVLSCAALTAACSPAPSPSLTPSSAAATTPVASASLTAAPPSARTTALLRAYFYLGGEPGTAGLVPLLREVEPGNAVRSAIAALLGGPTTDESALRTITSAIPDGSRLLGLEVIDGVATVDLSKEFESGGGSTSMFVRLGQVVYTLTQFSTVQSVVLKVEGRQVSVFGSEGIVLDRPQTRADEGEVLPAIFVDQPAYSGSLGNPARISGTADVLEAAFRVTILDAAGKTLADAPALASCGSGCRGTFDLTVPYVVDHVETGTLRVWDGSMKNGGPANVREYPVWLGPAG